MQTTDNSRRVKTLLDARTRLVNAMRELGVTPERIAKLQAINEKLAALDAIPSYTL